MSHVSVEMLSSYLDGELTRERRIRVERHLQGCEQCHHRLAGLRRAVQSIEGLGRISPTPYLEQRVLRIAAARERQESLLDRLERGAGRLHIERWVWLPTFGLVIALASIIYLFSWALHRQNQGLPVVLDVESPVSEAAEETTAPGEEGASPMAEGSRARSLQPNREEAMFAEGSFASRVTEIDGRFFELQNGLWIEQGVDPEEPSISLEPSEAARSEWQEVLPSLAELERLGGPVRLRFGDQLVQLEFDRR
jgi:hypothetical protein